MTTLSALAFPFMDKLCQAQFTNIDAFRRVQGEALGLLGFGPNECDYHVILSGSHWRLRKYADYDGQSSLLIVSCSVYKRGALLSGSSFWGVSPRMDAAIGQR